jgi:hypothetical protein
MRLTGHGGWIVLGVFETMAFKIELSVLGSAFALIIIIVPFWVSASAIKTSSNPELRPE